MQIKVLCISVIQSQQNHSRHPAACAPRATSMPALHPRPRQDLRVTAVLCVSPAQRCPSSPCPSPQDVAAIQLRESPFGIHHPKPPLKLGNKFRAPQRPSPGHRAILPSHVVTAKATVVQREHFLQP